MDAKPAARLHRYAGMAELADAQDLGSCEAIRVGSTPTTRTKVMLKEVNCFTAVDFFQFLLYIINQIIIVEK